VRTVFVSSLNLVCLEVCVCSSLANLKLDELVSRAGVAGRQRGCAGTQGIQEHACACESRECCLRAFTTELQSPPAREEEGG